VLERAVRPLLRVHVAQVFRRAGAAGDDVLERALVPDRVGAGRVEAADLPVGGFAFEIPASPDVSLPEKLPTILVEFLVAHPATTSDV